MTSDNVGNSDNLGRGVRRQKLINVRVSNVWYSWIRRLPDLRSFNMAVRELYFLKLWLTEQLTLVGDAQLLGVYIVQCSNTKSGHNAVCLSAPACLVRVPARYCV